MPRSFHMQRKWWLQAFVIRKKLCSLTLFRSPRLLRKPIKAKRPAKTKQSVIFHTGNVPAQHLDSNNRSYKLGIQPPFSPQMSSSDYFLFLNLKDHMDWEYYRSNDDGILSVEEVYLPIGRQLQHNLDPSTTTSITQRGLCWKSNLFWLYSMRSSSAAYKVFSQYSYMEIVFLFIYLHTYNNIV